MKTLAISVLLILLATPAMAQSKDWTGLYLGAHVGGAWGNASTKDNAKDGVPPGPFSYDAAGAFGGGTLGYNLQLDRIVLGVEGDLGYMDLSGDGIIGSAHADHHQNLSLDGGLYGDVTGRAGILVTPALLLYGKGGFAFYDGQANQATTADGYKPTGTGTFTGWVAGGGAEYRLTDAISIKAEFLHFDFGDQDGYQTNVGDTSSPIGYKFKNSTSLDADTVKLGIAYKF